jgi:hypothetical protein
VCVCFTLYIRSRLSVRMYVCTYACIFASSGHESVPFIIWIKKFSYHTSVLGEYKYSGSKTKARNMYSQNKMFMSSRKNPTMLVFTSLWRRSFPKIRLHRLYIENSGSPSRGSLLRYYTLLIGGWRTLHDEEFHNLYSSPSIIRTVKSRWMRWAGHQASMGRRGMDIGYRWESQKERDD